MTWDEAELRAALREGEGETLSAGHIMAIAEARQQRRHDRMRTAAVAVVVTGLLGGGVGVLTQLSGNSESGSSASANGAKAGRDDYAQSGGVAQAQAPARGAADGSVGSEPLAPAPSGTHALTGGGTSVGTASGSGSGSGSGSDCPKTPPAVRRPAATASGVAGPLFAEPVASLTVCGYRAIQPGARYRLRGAMTLTGAAARNLVAGLEQASRTPSDIGCPGVAQPTALIVLARSEAGAALAVVRVDDGGCGATVTNGTAVRYAWQVPKALAEFLD